MDKFHPNRLVNESGHEQLIKHKIIFISLSTQSVTRVLQVRIMQWEIQQAEAIPQSKHKLLTVIAYSTGGNVVQREVRWAEYKVWILLHLCAFLVCVLFAASKWICKQSSFSSVAPHDMAATEKKVQVTENRNLLLLEVFPQSRRFCIISYKSPIQTELMEYTLKQPPPPWPLNSHANKMYKYKEEENSQLGRNGLLKYFQSVAEMRNL